jgi:UDP-N-acetylmuramate dehydrogenase
VTLAAPEVRENVPLAPLTTLQIGGPARHFVEARGEEAVIAGLSFAEQRGLPVFILGGGSNVVVADEGFPGLVIRIAVAGISECAGADSLRLARLTAGAGEDWDGVIRRAVECGLAGIECLSGIPGTAGGTPVQNVGAYGQEVAETIRSVRAWDRVAHGLVELSNADCGFSYRQSAFNTTARDRYVVLAVTFELARGAPPALKYADLRDHFAGRPGSPTLLEVREAVRALRARKAMLLQPGDPDCRSAGSFFKNPVVSQRQYEQIVARAGGPIPHYPVGESGAVKVAAAWLIEQAGFHKGFARGPVGISTRHALALVNRGGASAGQLVALAREIRARVSGRFGIDLVPEPQFIGFHDPL